MRIRLLAMRCFAVLGLAALSFSSPALAQQKTVKACQDEWRANKAANQAKGVTEKDYVAQCRAGSATATSPPPAAAAPAAPATTAPAAKSAPAAKTTPKAANQFSTEAQAKSHCPSDTVVWVNLDSSIYHFAGNKSYGNTKSGAYMCERDTSAAGFRAAKNEKHP